MEQRVSNTTETLDTGFASIVNFQPEASTYVAEPVFVGERVIFLNDLEPNERALFEDFMPLPIEKYESLESFLADERPADDGVGTLNFLGYFQPAETLAGLSHKQRNVYRRLAVVAPELVTELEASLASAHRMADLDMETLEKLVEAYNLMADLVDARDAYSVAEFIYENGPRSLPAVHFDLDYLKH